MTRSIITLSTDFGLQDGYVAMMKGVILGIAPGVQIVDITHSIQPQAVLEGALVLQRAFAYFPEGTIHLAVVDPGVGTERLALALLIGKWYFVGPDNGLFTPLLEEAEQHNWLVEIVQLENPRYWLPSVSRTFHGRDVFAPVAAHLANGVPLGDLGTFIQDAQRLPLPRPEKTATGWRAHILAIDVFGNLATDFLASEISDQDGVFLTIHGHEIRGLITTYGKRADGELVALADSAGRLELAAVNDSAARKTGAVIGDSVDIILK